MSEPVFVHETKKGIVRIYAGKMTDEERKVVLEKAARDFYKAIQKTSVSDGSSFCA